MKPYTVSIYVNVHDRAELHAAAMQSYVQDNPGNRTAIREAYELFGTTRNPKLGACLIQLLDPGGGVPGVDILDSSAWN